MITSNISKLIIVLLLFFVVIIEPLFPRVSLLIVSILFLAVIFNVGMIKLPSAFPILLVIYIFILFYSVGNKAIFIDFRHHIYILIIFILLYQIRNRVNFFENFFKISFHFCTLVFFLYIFFYLDLIPSFYKSSDVPEYQAFRIVGPSLDIFLFLPFLYSMKQFPRSHNDKYLFLAFLMGLFSCAISGSNTSLVIHIIFYLTAFYSGNIKFWIFNTLLLVTLLIAGFGFLSEGHIEKISQIGSPQESLTVLTRINDLASAYERMLNQKENMIFGEGVGVTTEVLRISWDGKFSEYREFLEIDNGFFYVFHRLGIFGLLLYIALFFFLVIKFGSSKNKLMFFSYFLITNLMTIHIFNQVFAAFYTIFLIREKSE